MCMYICVFSMSIECKFGAFGRVMLSGTVEANCKASLTASLAFVCTYRDHAKTLLNTRVYK